MDGDGAVPIVREREDQRRKRKHNRHKPDGKPVKRALEAFCGMSQNTMNENPDDISVETLKQMRDAVADPGEGPGSCALTACRTLLRQTQAMGPGRSLLPARGGDRTKRIAGATFAR